MVRHYVAVVLFCNISFQTGEATTLVSAFKPQPPLWYPGNLIFNL
jgi:hypothetical protein